MTQNARQQTLFLAEDFDVIYESYTQANFQAYDYDTIRENMVEYIRLTYPDNFNDWVESSEFVALLDLIAQFGHSLAFRVDLNSRNNFLSTADRADSVYKLADFLGYKPKRNYPAAGLLKITSIKTNENVIGSNGDTLGGRELRFESTGNVNNLDDFLSAMNAVLADNNQFGNPKQNAFVDGVNTSVYDFNNASNQIYFTFSGNVQGSQKPFNCYSADYDFSNKSVTEKQPDPNGAFSIIHKDDGAGINSEDTGFFVAFKQGSLQFRDFDIQTVSSNRSIIIAESNINHDDVWVQGIDEDGNVTDAWTKLEYFTDNPIYNSEKSDEKTFSVYSRVDGSIEIKFSDIRFGTLPYGLIRVWFRTGENATYSLKPEDVSNVRINLNYIGEDGNTYTATMNLQLKVPVVNAQERESLDTIKRNAPRVYSSQDRMITGNDYNNYLYNNTGSVKKLKSINRTHSGHSRYTELHDPTGIYTNLDLTSTDGLLEKQPKSKTFSTEGLSSNEIHNGIISTALDDHEVLNRYYDNTDNAKEFTGSDIVWQAVDARTGFLQQDSVVIGISTSAGQTNLAYVKTGALVEFVNNSNGDVIWAKISNVYANGLGVDSGQGVPTGLKNNGTGAIELDTVMPDNYVATKVYPLFDQNFTARERNNILAFLESSQVQRFAIDYDLSESAWYIVESDEIREPVGSENHYILVDKEANQVIVNTTRYTISSDQLEFTNISNEYTLDEDSKKKTRDQILIGDSVFYVSGYELDNNGNIITNRAILTLLDNNKLSRPRAPDSFSKQAQIQTENLTFQWKHKPSKKQILDPSFTNIIEVFVLSEQYHQQFVRYLANENLSLPEVPSSDSFIQNSERLVSKKALSDTVVFHPAKYKILFGKRSNTELQAKFQTVKIPGVSLTDNEIKSRIVQSIQDFFNVENWDFGETFYFTELTAYVHQQLAGVVGSFIIIPQGTNSVFGNLFQITPESDELFIPEIALSDIEIVSQVNTQG